MFEETAVGKPHRQKLKEKLNRSSNQKKQASK
jgi:hypothetical protein